MCSSILSCFFLLAFTFIAAAIATAAPPVHDGKLVDVFVSGAEGYACYRIPALVFIPATDNTAFNRPLDTHPHSHHHDRNQINNRREGAHVHHHAGHEQRDEENQHLSHSPSLSTSGGTLLAFAEGRRFSCNDHGAVDLVVKRSTDLGLTWSPLRVVYGESATTNTTIGNPAPVLLRDGTVLLPFTRNNTAWGLLRSSDGGATWSPPAYQPSPHAWFWIATGPPGSIQLSQPSGRILIPMDYEYSAGASSSALVTRSAVLISDDQGQTWKLGASVAGGNECQAVSLPWLSPESVLLSMRALSGPSRLASLSNNSGDTFSTPWSTVTETECEASTIALPLHPAGPRVYMSSAFSSSRENLTLHVTGGHDLRLWTPRLTIYPGPAAYSALAATAPSDLAVLFERDNYKAITITLLANVPA